MMRAMIVSLVLSMPLMASAFSAGSIPALAPASRAVSHVNLGRVPAPRFGTLSLSSSDGILLKSKNSDKNDLVTSRVPEDPNSKCSCGSNLGYDKCCARFHQTGAAPEDPVDLIRARYSAYAYRLPGYIMRSTSRKSPDWTVNQAAWIEDIVDFCDSYRFKRPGGQVLGLELEECTYSSPEVCYVQFKAKMLGPGYRPVELVERSRVLRENGRWFYEKGTLLEYQGDLV
eukprot:CAMPEP_0181331402 /NCGR_PEP_ID=MMETSP1101-20121128/24476_1 /TAXON_ID=46948 /ORGANISM="Rhodomonas abbreviata, Strain Caron Lab Isolate" /LENGTH=228 /DNA_ID=CAMNT_0023440847 /DNA_START=37 /DNA_END=723 /DNA_ORIENTATION=-